jgi:hypothetical protein
MNIFADKYKSMMGGADTCPATFPFLKEYMSMPEEMRDTDSARTIIVRLTPDTHRALRIKVAEEDTSIQQWVEALIERALGACRGAARTGGGNKGQRS